LGRIQPGPVRWDMLVSIGQPGDPESVFLFRSPAYNLAITRSVIAMPVRNIRQAKKAADR
jgi:hypothetical protein